MKKSGALRKSHPPRVVLGVTGSIAAYKAAELTRRMIERGWEVYVIMTDCATRFVGEQTFLTLSRHPVGRDLFTEGAVWRPDHVSWAEMADVLVVAPCTANMIAKLAHGFADDLLSTTALATTAPLVIAPAMNDRMWAHAATRDNVAVLRRRGARIVDVGSGDLACGYQAKGRLADVEDILRAVSAALGRGCRR